jgi:N-methylhydantoinase A
VPAPCRLGECLLPLLIALDIGGTFTDLVAFDLAAGTIHHAKSSTTPYDLSVGIRETLRKSGLPIDAAETFIHGSTVAINTAIERTGARTALLVTEGTRDVYSIGRGNRPEAYNLFFKRPAPYVPRQRTREIAERLSAAGDVVTVLARDQARDIATALNAEDIEAVAVCFLHSWANPEHEIAVGNILADEAPGMYRSLSHEILREYREYERTSTTVLNAYVGPRVNRYLEDLERLLESFRFTGRLLIMQSNGGTMSPATAKRVPVATMESGPVGGIIAAAEVGTDLSFSNVIAFDMGGTTAKVSLVQNGEPDIAQGYFIGGAASGHPVMLPVVDIIEVGAGGGSIAWIDAVGALKVGPRSAGGHPGPVCYGQGGTEPTVTDANVVLGRVVASRFLGGEMPLDIEAARESIRLKIAEPLGMTVNEAALGIVKIAIAEMSLAVRGVSVARGFDPRDFAMLAFGGAGPLHAAEIARELHIPTLIIPRVPGHFSALGMLLADLRHDYVRTYYKSLVSSDFAEIARVFEEMIAGGRQLLIDEGTIPEAIHVQRFLDLRYIGQEFPIQTPVGSEVVAAADLASMRASFDELHDRRYGHQAVDEPIEIVNLRVTVTGRRERSHFASIAPAGSDALIARSEVVLDDANAPVECSIYDRERLGAGATVSGPAIIWEYASTTVLFAGDELAVAESGELLIRIGGQTT